jgi:hypothetical protein
VPNELFLDQAINNNELRLLLVFLSQKQNYQMTLKQYAIDLGIDERAVKHTLNTLIDKGILNVDNGYCKLNIETDTRVEIKLKGIKLTMEDKYLNRNKKKPELKSRGKNGSKLENPNKEVNVTTSILNEKTDVAPLILVEETNVRKSENERLNVEEPTLQSQENDVTTLIEPDVTLDAVSVEVVDKINNTGSDERNFKNVARPSDNIKQDSVNALNGVSSLKGNISTPVSNSNDSNIHEGDFFNNIESVFSEDGRAPLDGAPPSLSSNLNEDIIPIYFESDEIFYFVYRWWKAEKDENDNFKFNFNEFEKYIAVALSMILDKHQIDLTSKKVLQRNEKYVKRMRFTSNPVYQRCLQSSMELTESDKPDDLEFLEAFPFVYGLKPDPTDEKSVENPLPAKPIPNKKDRVKGITKNLRKKYEKERQK